MPTTVAAPATQPRQRAWTPRVVGILLIVQAIAAALIYPILAIAQVWRTPGLQGRPIAALGDLFSMSRIESLSITQPPLMLSIQDIDIQIQPDLLASEFLVPLAVPLLLVGVLFLLSWRPAWVGAVLLQGVILALALTIYFEYRPVYVYPIMLYGILMVLYLNHFEVREAFAPQPLGRERQGGVP